MTGHTGSFLTDEQLQLLAQAIADAIAAGTSTGAGAGRGSTTTSTTGYYGGGGFMSSFKRVLTEEEMEQKKADILAEQEEQLNRNLLSVRRMTQLREEETELIEREKELQDKIFDKLDSGTATTEELVKLEEELLKVQEKRLRNFKEQQQLGGDGFLASTKRHVDDINKCVDSLNIMYKAVRSLADPWAKAEHAASQYTKTLGGTGASMNKLLETTLSNMNDNKLAGKYNISTEELLQAQANYMKGAGRTVRVSNSDQEDISAVNSVMGQKGVEMMAQYEQFGVSMKDSAKHLGKMYKEATESGISLEKYADNVSKNIKLAQNFTFKNGIKGLESMAKKSAALKLDMQQAANFASKVNTVEGSIETSAQLQVLGGPFAQLADPLGMLNEGLNDMEGLFDRMAKMVGGLGTFDKTTGEVKVSSFDKQRIMAASKAMGVDYGQLMESVNRQAVTKEIESQISQSSNAKNLDPKMIELIKNQGVIQDGKAGISIDGKFTALEDITNSQFEALKAETQTQSENIRDIAINVRSLIDEESGWKKQVDSWMAEAFDWLGKGFKVLVGLASTAGLILSAVVAFKAMSAVGSFLKGGGNIFKAFRRFGGGGARALSGSAQALSGSAQSIGKIGGSSIFKHGLGRATKRAALKTFGRGIGGKLISGVAKGGALGIVGAVGNMATDALVANGTIKRGGTGHHIGKGLSGAATGAAIGSFLGPIGTAVGAGIGALVGLNSANKEKHKAAIENKLKDSGATLKGDYGRSDLKDISAAISSGKISSKLREKLEAEGDTEVLKVIDKKGEEKAAQKRREMEQNGGFGPADSVKKLIMAKFYSEGLKYFQRQNGTTRSSSTSKGSIKGKLYGGLIGMAMGGPIGGLLGATIGSKISKDKVEEKKKTSNFNPLMFNAVSLPFLAAGLIKKAKDSKDLNVENSTIKPVEETGKNNDAKKMQENASNNTNTASSSVQPQEIKKEVVVDTVKETQQTKTPTNFNVNITGELKLTSPNGQSVDIIRMLKENPDMLAALSQMIAKQMRFDNNQTNVVEKAGQ